MQITNYVASLSDMNQTIDKQAQRTYNAKEVGEIFGYMLQSLGYPFQPMNLNNGILYSSISKRRWRELA